MAVIRALRSLVNAYVFRPGMPGSDWWAYARAEVAFWRMCKGCVNSHRVLQSRKVFGDYTTGQFNRRTPMPYSE